MVQDNSQVQEFDLIVIGAGSGGVRAARISAQHGAKVAVVESSRLGGTCVNLGCVPKKLMAYASHFAHDFQDAKGYGWTVNSPEFSWKTLIENKNAEIDRLNGIYGGMLEKNGVELYRGLGRYLKAANAKHMIRVDQEEGSVDICAKRVLIATGGKADRPDIPGAEHMLVSDDLFYLEELPKSIAMVGSGYISVEFASIFAGLGVDVHLMIRNDAFLREFDSQLGAWCADAFKERGIHVHQRMNVKSVEKAGDKSVLSYDQDGEVKTLEVDHVVSAIGRSALVPKGVEASIPEGLDKKGFIPVNNKFETSLPGLYAVETDSRGERRFHYWRESSAAKDLMNLVINHKVSLRNVDLIYFSGITMAVLSATQRQMFLDFLIENKRQGTTIAFDPNYRPILWEGIEQAADWTRQAYALSDIVFPGVEDHAALYGHFSSQQIVAYLSPMSPKEIVLKDGANPVRVITQYEDTLVPVTQVSHVVDTTSAGDGFTAGYLACRAKQMSVKEAVEFAAQLAGTIIRHPGAIIPRHVMPCSLATTSSTTCI